MEEVENHLISIEKHRAWIEEPYALMVQLDGEITGDNMRQLRDHLDLIGGGSGPVIIMQDMSKAGAFTAAARKGIMDDERTQRVMTVICIGASFQMQVFIGMVRKAARFVNPRLANTIFAKTEEEARKMLAAERQRLQQEG